MGILEKFASQNGRFLKENDSYINIADSYKQIKENVTVQSTLDSFRAAVIDGNAYKVGFADVTGIPVGAEYFYYVKNTSDAKSIWLRPIDISTGTLLVRYIKNGIFTLNGSNYNPEDYIDITVSGSITTGSPYVIGTFDTDKIKPNMIISGIGIPNRTFVYEVTSTQITMTNIATETNTQASLIVSLATFYARNLNSSSTNQASMKMWFQNTLGTIAYADSLMDQAYNIVDYEMYETSKLTETMTLIAPGDSFMGILSNYGTAKIPYRINIEWSEV